VVHLAARVGGLFANINDKVAFYEQNMSINQNVIKSSYLAKVKRLVCCLSTCIYPDVQDQAKFPISEMSLHEGPPHPSNAGYAYAKRMCQV
jgi:GDP-L-fucose synthase